MRKSLLYIILLSLGVLSACGSASTAHVPTQVPTYTQAPSPVPTSIVEPTKEPSPSLEPTYTPMPTREPSSTPTPEPLPTATSTPSPVPTATSTPSPTPSSTPSPTATPSPSPVPTSTPVPTATPKPTETQVPTVTSTPTPTPSPKPTATPSPTPAPTPKPTNTPTPVPTKAPVSNSDKLATWGDDTVELEKIGVTIPTLKDFNDLGLEGDNSWFGDIEDPGYSDLLNDNLDTLDAVQNALIDKNIIGLDANGFTLSNSDLTFHYSSWSATGDLELNKNKTDGYYEVVINRSLKEDIVYGKDVAGYNREILVAMLSMISSEPQELEAKIYQDIYGDICISDTSWTNVGDAKAQFDYDASYKNHYVYKIKPQ